MVVADDIEPVSKMGNVINKIKNNEKNADTDDHGSKSHLSEWMQKILQDGMRYGFKDDELHLDEK